MGTARQKRKPLKSWQDFTSWAQDFSLMQKVLGGFFAVVLLVGLATSFVGTNLARDTIMESARKRLLSDLVTAEVVLQNTQESLELKLRMTADSETLRTLVRYGDMESVARRLTLVCEEKELDFLAIATPEGKVIARAFSEKFNAGSPVSDPIIQAAFRGKGHSGMLLISGERLAEERSTLVHRLPGEHGSRGMVLEAAQPMKAEHQVFAVIYGGILINNGNVIVDRMSRLAFAGDTYGGLPIGFVAIYQGKQAISSTLRGEDGLPLAGFEAAGAIQRNVLVRGESAIELETLTGRDYLSAARPIRDVEGKIVGAIELAQQQKPITSVIDRLVVTFLTVALVGVLLMACITYFLVRWINHPLQLMLNAARRAADGDLTQQVPVIARDEVGELAATFNLMIRNLADSKARLEEWGEELASKIAVQAGALDEAREQVARVQKLASLEKMADGMSHIMAHISDPMGSAAAYDEGAAHNRILIIDHDENTLDICQRSLENEGFEVVTAPTVEDGLCDLQEDFFDVVVADIDMPSMSGKDMLKEIKYRQPDVLVILTAPFKATEEAEEAVKLGAFDYIPKPFGPHQITFMVYTALQTRQAVERTRREHAAQRAEKIFQRLPVAIALADKAHRVVYNNKAFLELASRDGQTPVRGKTFYELFGVDPLEIAKTDGESPRSAWLELKKLGRTAKLYNFKLLEEDLRVLMLLDVTETVKKDQQAEVFRAETLTRAQRVIHQQMRVAQEIAGLLGETTAETKAALFELINLAKETGESR